MKSLLFAFAFLVSITIAKAASVEPITTEGIVNAAIEEVWKSFSTKEGIESWMVAKTEFELRVGATWRTSYSKDSNLNDDASIHHIILAYDPGRMLASRDAIAEKRVWRVWPLFSNQPGSSSMFNSQRSSDSDEN